MEVSDMRGQYKAAFILPLGTARQLGECGWEFDSRVSLSKKEVTKFLTDKLKLEFSHQDFGIDYYISESIEASIDYGNSGLSAEHVYVQVYNDQLQFLKEAFDSVAFNDQLELFIPSFET
jgi:hypothetical protein